MPAPSMTGEVACVIVSLAETVLRFRELTDAEWLAYTAAKPIAANWKTVEGRR